MLKNKPVTLLITVGLLLLLIAIAGIYPLISGSIRSAGPGGENRPLMQRTAPDGKVPFSGDLPSGMTPPEGFQPGDGQSMQGNPGAGFFGTMTANSSVGMKLMQLLQILQTVGAVVVILFAVLAILGVFLAKDWGRKLALTVGILAILFTIAGMFNFMMGLTLWIKISTLVVAAAIVVFSSLSKSRLTATVPA